MRSFPLLRVTRQCLFLGLTFPLFPQTAVPTYHNDNARSGLNSTEILLSPPNVQAGQFGKRFEYPVDGVIYAQPLYVPRVMINGKLHNVVFVATAHDSVYAFDADDPVTNPDPLWQTSFLDANSGVTTVPEADVNCPVISPELGIVGTPAIDTAAGTMYVIAETKEAGPSYVFRLHAIDIASGDERPNSPVVISATGFEPTLYKHRGALLVANGLVYSEWSSHCDHGSYHGFLMAHDGTTLNPVAVFNATPNGESAAFWNAGAGPAADANGNVFAVSANGDFDASVGNYGDSVIRLQPQDLTIADFFTPYDQEILADNDLDLGSSGSLLLPDQAGNASHPHLLVTAGKEGRIYLLDRDQLGGAQISADLAALASDNVLGHSTFGMAAWFNGQLYIASEFSPLRSYALADATLSATPSAQTLAVIGELGATPSISSNGTASGIVWTNVSNAQNGLQAYDATTLDQLFDSSATDNSTGGYSEFMVPTVGNSHVYLGTRSGLSVFGETSLGTPLVAGVVNAASFTGPAVAPGSLVSIFGSQLSLISAGVTTLPLPISFADVEVLVNGFPAPLLYVSAGQINAQIPAGIPAGQVSLVVRNAGAVSAPFALTVQPSAPGLFQFQEAAFAVNANGSINGSANPAPAGSYISVYLTGSAALQATAVDGEPADVNGAYPGTNNVQATVGGVPASVQYAGPAPNYVGLIQMNLQVPALPAGTYPVAISVDGASANQANVYISSE